MRAERRRQVCFANHQMVIDPGTLVYVPLVCRVSLRSVISGFVKEKENDEGKKKKKKKKNLAQA